MPRPAKRKETTPVDPKAKRSTSARRASLRSADEASVNSEPPTLSSSQTGLNQRHNLGKNSQTEAIRSIAQQMTSFKISNNEPRYTSSVTSTTSNHDPNFTFNGINRGKMRNIIEVHVKTKNGEPMRTNITHKVAFQHFQTTRFTRDT